MRYLILLLFTLSFVSCGPLNTINSNNSDGIYGNKAEIIIVPGADHAFIAFPCETTSAVIEELNKFCLLYTSDAADE